MSIKFSIPNQDQAVNSPAFSGPTTPLLEELTRRPYTRHRSRLVDRWIAYADAEGFIAAAATRQGVAL